MNTDGSSFAVLQHLVDKRRSGPIDGNGLRGLVLSGNTIYGAAPTGGDQGIVAIYRIDLVSTISIGRMSADSLRVSWPSAWNDYVLQQSVNGFSSPNWSNVTAGIQNDGTSNTVVINPPVGNRFYRLLRP